MPSPLGQQQPWIRTRGIDKKLTLDVRLGPETLFVVNLVQVQTDSYSRAIKEDTYGGPVLVFSSIPWASYAELEIQELITYCFEQAGYTVSNLHVADPARERGVDLLATKGPSRCAIAVKCKPKDENRSQLQDLAEYDAGRRIYAYASTPTHPFIDFMQRREIKGNVEFWSGEELGFHLYELDPFIVNEIVLCYHSLCVECIAVVDTLEEIYREAEKLSSKEHKTLASSIRRSMKPQYILWDVKDHSSALHKTASGMSALFQKMSTSDFTSEQQMSILKHSQEVLDRLQEDLVSRLHYEIIELLEDLHDPAVRVVSATRYRSNWKHMFNFRKVALAFYAERVLDTLGELRTRKRVHNTLRQQSGKARAHTLAKRVSELTQTSSPGLAAIAWFFELLEDFAEGLEDFIDDIYQSLTEDDFDLHWSDWRTQQSSSEAGLGESEDDSGGFLPRIPTSLLSYSTRDDRVLRELAVIRWHLATGLREFLCPQCGSNLTISNSSSGAQIKCSDDSCGYCFQGLESKDTE